MRTVSSIEKDRYRKGKYRVALSDGTSLLLYGREVSTYSLREGEDVSEELFSRILSETLFPRARKYTLHLLERMDRTEAEIRRKLYEKGYPEEAADDAVSYAMSYHYIDDNKYAHMFVRNRQSQYSRLRIRMDLLKKGVAKETVDEAIADEYVTAERDLIEVLLKKRHFDPSTADNKEREKLCRFLLQRGFTSSDVYSAVMGREY